MTADLLINNIDKKSVKNGIHTIKPSNAAAA